MIRILVDSASDLNKNDPVCDFFIPIAINIDGTEYLDGETLDSDMFYRLLETSSSFPRTSQPSPQTFIDIFEQAQANGDELIYFAPSSVLSGTYQCACLARTMVDYDGIHIFDSKAATHIIGLLARLASQLAAQGARVEEIFKKCEDLRARIRIVAGVDTLEYLHKGGRMSKMFAVVGELSRIKPVITITPEGTAEPLAKCLGRSRAMQYIVNAIKNASIDERFPLYSLYTFGEENCSRIEEKLSAIGQKVASRLQIGSTIGAHIGPGVYGVMYVAK